MSAARKPARKRAPAPQLRFQQIATAMAMIPAPPPLDGCTLRTALLGLTEDGRVYLYDSIRLAWYAVPMRESPP